MEVRVSPFRTSDEKGPVCRAFLFCRIQKLPASYRVGSELLHDRFRATWRLQ